MEALKQIAAWLSRKSEATWQPLVVDDAGFCAGTVRAEWKEVRSIAAFKRDHLTLDDVWFELDTAAGPVMVCEEQPGFAEWERALCVHFPAASEWRQAVIHPAFAENFTVLYRQT